MATIATHRTRIARPTGDLAATRHFYAHVIGLPVLAGFADHDGYDGVVFTLGDNPYWWRAGARVFVDPDGYRVLIVPRDAL